MSRTSTGLAVSTGQFRPDGIQRDAVVSQDQQGMKHEIGHFIHNLGLILILRRQEYFSGLLRYLLENSVRPAFQELGNI